MTHAINTPGKKWIPAAKVIAETPTHGDTTVSGFYKRLSSGIHFYGLDGVLFACLITNRHGERFFVTASETTKGPWFMHSTCSLTDIKLGIDGLGYRAQKELEQYIVDELDTLKANAALAKHGVTFEQFVGMANQEPTADTTLQAIHIAGLTHEPQGIEDDGYLLATRLGRHMLGAAGYAPVNGKWVKTAGAIAA
ncbi:hypothetical protein H8F21_13610 [Pseudomonas sp. P66]|uniref:Uncharacterized protein n=1 Tax=Pseudomonas arcuscaelestis TaxID=2710591 RepID=A0ABS2C036_9PSED|nr:hypothetical protein [Pseudomonas arcuscaelestis]MBM5458601.1 hypothetical protein [Pseudomonas arcuscaelestis]